MGDEQLVGESHRQRMARAGRANLQAAKRQRLAENRNFFSSLPFICGL